MDCEVASVVWERHEHDFFVVQTEDVVMAVNIRLEVGDILVVEGQFTAVFLVDQDILAEVLPNKL